LKKEICQPIKYTIVIFERKENWKNDIVTTGGLDMSLSG
jgi:hypothetical protein